VPDDLARGEIIVKLAIIIALASLQSHGWADVNRTYEHLEQRVASGQRIYVPCGVASVLAKRALERVGIPARLVGTFRAPSKSTRAFLDVPAGVLESHAMVEAWLGGRWVLIDVDANVWPTTRRGRSVTLAEFSRMRRRYYRPIATDPLRGNLSRSSNPAYEQWLFSHPAAWRKRVDDIPAIMPYGSREYVYTGRERLPFPGYRWVPRPEWDRLVGEAPNYEVREVMNP
jgi:hypothetical protein